MKRIATAALLFCAVLFLAGCGGSTTEETTTTKSPTATTTKQTTAQATPATPTIPKGGGSAGRVGSALLNSLKKGATDVAEGKTETP